MTSESQYLAALSRIFASNTQDVLVGIGDDGAVIEAKSQSLILATDMVVEGNHFKRDWSSLFEIGAKVTAANLADAFAMGGVPTHILVAAAINAVTGVGAPWYTSGVH